VVAHIAEARADGITVLQPDVNESDLAFGVAPDPKKAGRSAHPLRARRDQGVGENAIEGILAARAKTVRGLYDSARGPTCARSTRVVEALVTAGAFDFTGKPRKALFECIEAALQQGASAQKDRESGQFGLFGGGAKRGTRPRRTRAAKEALRARRLVRRLRSSAEEPELTRLAVLLRGRTLLQRRLDALEQRLRGCR